MGPFCTPKNTLFANDWVLIFGSLGLVVPKFLYNCQALTDNSTSKEHFKSGLF